MSHLQYFVETVDHLMRELASIAESNSVEIGRRLQFTNTAIEMLDIILQSPTLSRADKQKVQTCMNILLFVQSELQKYTRSGRNIQIAGPSNGNSESMDVDSSSNIEISRSGGVQWRDVRSAFKTRIRTGIIININHLDISTFMQDAYELFQSQISKCLENFSSLKVNAELAAQFSVIINDEEVSEIKFFNTESCEIYRTTDLEVLFKEKIADITKQDVEEFQERDSGWQFKSILSLTMNICKLNRMRAGSYIELPKYIAKKTACINVKNNDDECFKWAVLSAIHPPKTNHPERVSHYQWCKDELKFEGIEFPMKPKDIPKFEKQNDISVNLYILKKIGEKFEVSPYHLTSLKKVQHVNLLLIQNFYIDDESESQETSLQENETIQMKFHYVWIKNLSRLVSRQISSSNRKCHICDRCLHFFPTEDKLNSHDADCLNTNKYRVKLPSENDKILKFKNFTRDERVPFVIYADFECVLKPVEDEHAFQQHEAFSVGYYLKCSFDDSRSFYKSYSQRSENSQTPGEWFVSELKWIAAELEVLYESPIGMNLTDREILAFERATICYICRKPFNEKDGKVRDHCHLTGRFRGAAHNSCNLNYKYARYVPIVLHNLSRYDSHLLIINLTTDPNFKGQIEVIPENKEQYISFTKHLENCSIYFRFIDSFRFLTSSLEKLSSYLSEIKIARKEFERDGYSNEQIELLKRKGVFPYDHVDNLQKLQQTYLPEKEIFYSKLTEEHISEEDYNHARNVWNSFNIQNLGQYSDLYLKTDVLLLADVFESFRATCLESYKLDPCHYYSAPGLAWDAALKITGIELELLTDIEMLLFIEKGIRGGISQCSNRYARANNPYMGEAYNPNEMTRQLFDFDLNNLYGWAMTQLLPFGKFKWIEPEDKPFFFNEPADSKIGYIAEVDLEYPKEIHDKHSDLPFCPEHLAPPGSKQKKLLTTLYDKEKYVIHYCALKQALDNGLRLKKVHRILSFEQKAWLKPYVELNTEKRKQAKNEFDKLFFKLMINAVYGKTMENERKRVDVKLITKWEGRYGAEARIAQPNFHSCSIFRENLVAIQLRRTSITIRKPIYVGLAVLDLSKTLFYEFHYSYILPQFGDFVQLLYSDTDSYIYLFRKVNVYPAIKRDIHRFDTSDYPVDNQFGIPRMNKKVIGLVKDECNGKIMTEFIGLRSKMYSVRIEDKEFIKKAKGVKTSVVKRTINFEDYYKCLFENAILKREQCNIRSKLHVTYTEKRSKIALSPYDNKRYLLKNSTDTLPWGHRIMEEKMAAAAEMEAELSVDVEMLVSAAMEVERELEGEGELQRVGSSIQKRASSSGEHIRLTDEPPCKRPRIE